MVLLRQDGHQVDFAINGYAALDVARRFQPEVVLLDLGLPGLDGFDVCRRLKSVSKDLRIVAVTAYASDEHHAKARAAGCDLHVVKPYDPQRLLAIVVTAGVRKQSLQSEAGVQPAGVRSIACHELPGGLVLGREDALAARQAKSVDPL